MKTIKIGVIGLGSFGETHCQAWANISGVELHALCTRRQPRLAELADRFGVARTYTDYREMLQDSELDAVDIVTMWDQHVEPALAALAAGKHVFLEKPMASTVADCEKIVAAAKRSSHYLMVGHICRFNPRYAAAKEAIAAGRIGKIVSMYARRNIPVGRSGEILDKIGPIIGDGVHDADLMLWYSQDRILSAYAQTVNTLGHKYPEIGWSMFRFASGATGVLENVWRLPPKTAFQIDERMEIVGAEGTIHIHETHPNFSICDSQGWHSPDTTYWPVINGVRGGALRDELTYFAQCIREQTPPAAVSPGEAMEAVRACLAAEESAATGAIVNLA